MRVVVLMIVALALAGAGWAAVRATGSVGPNADTPVIVGSVRLSATELEAAAVRLAGRHPQRLPAARRRAAARAIERLWLEGEAAARGLTPTADLRGQVADALVGPKPPSATGLAAAFEAFHQRWRRRTRCVADYAPGDLCSNVSGTGTCRWMGEATVCGTRVIRDRPRYVLRARSRAEALAAARSFYVVARAKRARAGRAARAAAKRKAVADARAAERARVTREREARARNPRLESDVLTSAKDACRRQLQESDPFLFAFGMQDVAGQVEGLIAARTTLVRGLRTSPADDVDRRKLRPLIDAIDAGSRELARLAAAEAGADLQTIADRVARLDARTEPERAISRRLGLGDCLARPGRPR